MTFSEAAEIYPILGGHAAARVHAPWLVRRKDQYDPIVLSRLELGLRRSPEELAWAETEQRRILDAFAAIFARYSFIALPSTGGPAVTKAEATLEHRRQLLALNTPGSLAGLPALAAPVDLGDGLTAGVQFLFPDMPRFGWQGPLENLNLL
jgi:amidase/aspartyl-tRNA(Asn)/glutamyl-tRNA(Gln) amidotransferase subunit A